MAWPGQVSWADMDKRSARPGLVSGRTYLATTMSVLPRSSPRPKALVPTVCRPFLQKVFSCGEKICDDVPLQPPCPAGTQELKWLDELQRRSRCIGMHREHCCPVMS